MPDPDSSQPPQRPAGAFAGDQTVALSQIGATDSGPAQASPRAPADPPMSGITAAGPPPVHAPPSGGGSSVPSSHLSSSSFFNHGRFVPGEMVAGRYRIVAMIGKGGMGEVYRADDLRLGQTVALKFLPPAYASDPAAIARLHTEVRLAREIAHPNVCRVYDVGEVNGQPFLSMQYVDGENLASLLRRIDRLPREKAVDLARQLTTGLAAAHDRGVLHRDLKPANVMLDARGKLLITDFGLSAAVADPATSSAEPGVVGTPAYMAPEQLAGQPATVRSDIYSLGLVVYELFTGRPVFKAETFDQLRRQRDAFDPASLAERMEKVDVDPLVIRVITRCVQRDPLRRPSRALAVLAALPGGDPLAAALAAGETPTPEMVAAAGGTGALPYRRAVPLLAAVVLPVLVLALFNAALLETAPPVPADEDPAILADYAAQTLKTLGYPGGPSTAAPYTSWGLDWDAKYFAAAARLGAPMDDVGIDADAAAKRKRHAMSRRAGGNFWYRQSPKRLVPSFLSLPVAMNDPPMTEPGMAGVVLGAGRQLLRFVAVGPAFVPGATGGGGGWGQGTAGLGHTVWADAASGGLMTAPSGTGSRASPAPAPAPPKPTTAPVVPPEWLPFLERAQVEAADLRPATPIQNPPVNSDRRLAWTIEPRDGAAAAAAGPARPVRVEAAALAGKPVYFAVLRSWEVPVATGASVGTTKPTTEPTSTSAPATAPSTLIVGSAPQRSGLERVFDYVGFFVRWSIWVGAAALAVANARVGRCDRKSAFRVGLVVFLLYAGSTVLRAAHQPPSVAENTVLFNCLAMGLLRGAMAWLFYLALEPYVRRAWPDWLISWTRLMGGQVRDALVGRDVLGGLAVAAGAAVLLAAATLAFVKLGGITATPGALESTDALRSTRAAAAGLLVGFSFAAISAVAFPFVACAVLGLTGSRRAVFPVAGAVLFLLMFQPTGDLRMSATLVAINVAARLLAMARFGALGLAACSLGTYLLTTYPPVMDPTPWYATTAWTITAALLALAAYAMRSATRGQPLLREDAMA